MFFYISFLHGQELGDEIEEPSNRDAQFVLVGIKEIAL